MDGEEVSADLIIDTMGRRSNLPNWLEAIGARRPIEEAEDSGFIYYTRFFRSGTGVMPAYRAELLTYFHSFSFLTLPGDAGTWAVTVVISSGDQALKKLRNPKPWAALVAACPLHAHWLDGEPITDVLSMAGTIDRYRRGPARTRRSGAGSPSASCRHSARQRSYNNTWITRLNSRSHMTP
jgi:hypothetical protein